MASKKQQLEKPKDYERQFDQVLKRLIQAPAKPPAGRKAAPKRKKQARG